MKHAIITTLLCLSALCSTAGERHQAIDIRTDKIIINTDSLGLPVNTTAFDVLSLLLELAERTKNFILENYTIQINDKTVGDARDAVPQQIRIADLKWIEVFARL